MPGFLGVEKQFHTKYGKKIMAIRDPKASAKEREQGVLAMESLHRQVWLTTVVSIYLVMSNFSTVIGFYTLFNARSCPSFCVV